MSKKKKQSSPPDAAFRRKKLMGYCWKARGSFLPGLLFEGCSVALDLFAPFLVAEILNKQIQELHAFSETGRLFRLLAIYLLAMLFSSIFRYASGIFLQRSANGIARMIQLDVFSHLQKLPIAYFDSLPAGKVVSRVTNDSNAVNFSFPPSWCVLYPRVFTALASISRSPGSISGFSFWPSCRCPFSG